MPEDFTSDNRSYGALLGDYFDLVNTIGEMERHFDPDDLADREAYQRLLTRRDELQARLDTVALTKADSDIKQVLDEAFDEL